MSLPKSANRLQRVVCVSDSVRYISQVATAFAESQEIVGDPVVQSFLGQLRSRSITSLLDTADRLASTEYHTPAQHYSYNQLAAFVRKVPFDGDQRILEQRALEKFRAAEHTCRRINQRFNAERRVGERGHVSLRIRARAYIVRAIGHEPNLPLIYESCGFGPGASVGVHGNSTHFAEKLCKEKWTCTGGALDYARAAMSGDTHIREHLLGDPQYSDHSCESFRRAFEGRVQVVDANKIVFVPKTAKVHRTIAIEPLLNGYLQTGVDQYMKRALRRMGHDLEDQSKNQMYAAMGSLGGFNPYCTIDLSSASDSVAINMVRDLLPPDWFSFLCCLRSPSYRMGGSTQSVRFEKFCSMGNGFCFPLETLIFASLAYAVGVETGDRDFSVYGDDIIVRQRTALYLIEVLKFHGFSINRDKTFIIGPFRESCGADYFGGVNVRPYTLTHLPKTDRDVYKFYNGYQARSHLAFGDILPVISGVLPASRYLRPVPGPDDTALTVPMDVFMSSRCARWDRYTQAWTWKEYIDHPVSDDRRAPPAVQMYGLLRGARPSRGHVPEQLLRRKTRTAVKKSYGPNRTNIPSNWFIPGLR